VTAPIREAEGATKEVGAMAGVAPAWGRRVRWAETERGEGMERVEG